MPVIPNSDFVIIQIGVRPVIQLQVQSCIPVWPCSEEPASHCSQVCSVCGFFSLLSINLKLVALFISTAVLLFCRGSHHHDHVRLSSCSCCCCCLFCIFVCVVVHLLFFLFLGCVYYFCLCVDYCGSGYFMVGLSIQYTVSVYVIAL